MRPLCQVKREKKGLVLLLGLPVVKASPHRARIERGKKNTPSSGHRRPWTSPYWLLAGPLLTPAQRKALPPTVQVKRGCRATGTCHEAHAPPGGHPSKPHSHASRNHNPWGNKHGLGQIARHGSRRQIVIHAGRGKPLARGPRTGPARRN